MAFGVSRWRYKRRCRFYPGDTRSTGIYWFPAPPGAPFYDGPFPTPFSPFPETAKSALYPLDPGQCGEEGPVLWHGSVPAPWATGDVVCGTDADYTGTAPVPDLLPDGTVAGEPRLLWGTGGLSLGGAGTAVLEPYLIPTGGALLGADPMLPPSTLEITDGGSYDALGVGKIIIDANRCVTLAGAAPITTVHFLFAPVAETGAYADLTGLPTLGSAAASDVTDFDPAGAAAAAVAALGTAASHAATDFDPAGAAAAAQGAAETYADTQLGGYLPLAVGSNTVITVAAGKHLQISGALFIPADTSFTGVTTTGEIVVWDVGGTLTGLSLPAYAGSVLVFAPSLGWLLPLGTATTAYLRAVSDGTGNATLAWTALSAVAGTGAYADLTGLPTLGTAAAMAAGAFDAAGAAAAVAAGLSSLTASLAAVATTGAYADLTGRPALAAVATTGAYADLTGRPALAAVATTGAYGDLTGRPTLGTAAAAATTDFDPAGAAAAAVAGITAASTAPRGYIDGLILSKSAARVVGVSAGLARDSGDAVGLTLSTAWTKSLSGTWAAGTGANGLDAGSVLASGTYHVWLIRNPTTPAVDVLLSASATAPTMPTGYTQSRRVGSVLTDGSSNIVAFSQMGDEFLLADAVAVSGAASALAAYATLRLPTGARLWAVLDSFFGASVTLLYSPDANDLPATGTAWTDQGAAGPGTPFRMRTNTSAQVRVVADGAGRAFSFRLLGWIDPRGKDA